MKAVDAMKPTSLRTFSLRTLLVIVTLVAMAFGFVAENWHQQRLVDDVLQAAESDNCVFSAIGYHDGGVYMWIQFSDRLSEDTAGKMVRAKRLAWMDLNGRTNPAVHSLLKQGFVEEPPWKMRADSDWHRKGKAMPSDHSLWYYSEWSQSKRTSHPTFVINPPPGDPYDWPVIDLVFWPYKKQMVFGVAIAVGSIGWVVARRWMTKKRTLR